MEGHLLSAFVLLWYRTAPLYPAVDLHAQGAALGSADDEAERPGGLEGMALPLMGKGMAAVRVP